MHWCPQETEAVMAGAGAVGMSLIALRWRWQQIKRGVNLRLLARHLHRCGATCDCRRYMKLVPMAA